MKEDKKVEWVHLGSPTGDIVTTADTSPTGKYCDECGSYDHTTKEH